MGYGCRSIAQTEIGEKLGDDFWGVKHSTWPNLAKMKGQPHHPRKSSLTLLNSTFPPFQPHLHPNETWLVILYDANDRVKPKVVDSVVTKLEWVTWESLMWWPNWNRLSVPPNVVPPLWKHRIPYPYKVWYCDRELRLVQRDSKSWNEWDDQNGGIDCGCWDW